VSAAFEEARQAGLAVMDALHVTTAKRASVDEFLIERLIASGYRFLMPSAPRSSSALEQGCKLADGVEAARVRPVLLVRVKTSREQGIRRVRPSSYDSMAVW